MFSKETSHVSDNEDPNKKEGDEKKPDGIDWKGLFTGTGEQNLGRMGMPDEDDPDPKGPPLRTILFYALLVVLVVALVAGITTRNDNVEADELATSEFVTAVSEDRVAEATYKATDATIKGKYWADEKDKGNKDKLSDFTSTYLGTDSLAEMMAAHPQITYKADVSTTPSWVSTLIGFVPMLLFILVMVWMLNRMQDPNSGAMAFGKTKARTNDASRPKVKFTDVAGCEEAIEELQEIKAFLENPKKFEDMGAKIPRGVLLVGPPGTGKTLLAKAVAGEAGVPFFSISGSDFVEMFVGVGASRVRDLFGKAKASSPSIIFIDEIDAVGRQRGTGLGGGHDEREQTLNQLLVEMDGFEDKQSVILIAATNRPDILDPALLRPGRFDRQITVDRPDVAGREAILKIHSRNKPLSSDVELDKVARLTPGFSGADLGNLMNESALLAARRNLARIGMNEINEAMERVIAGPERRGRVMTNEERTTIAYHESGHALVGHVLPNADPVHKITIMPRGQALGYTLSLPDEDHFLQTRSAMTEQIAVLLGGRTAEELFCRDITTGASNDLERATKMAKAMVTRYGMSDDLGAQVYGEGDHEVFLGRDLAGRSDYSPETARRIDAEVSRLIEEGHKQARAILSERADQMHLMAKVLLERETVDGKACTALLENTWDEYLAHEEEDKAAVREADAALTASEQEGLAMPAAEAVSVVEVTSANARIEVGADGSTTIVRESDGSSVTLPPVSDDKRDE